MKKLLLPIVLFISVGFSQKEYDINHIVEVNGVYYKKFSDEIVNGKVFDGDFHALKGTMKEGKKDGKWIIWNDDGTKEREETYKDGKEIGSIEWDYYSDKQKKREWKHKGGKIEYNYDNIVEVRNDFYIKKFSDEVVSGKVFRMYGVLKAPLGMIKNGMKEGIWIIWNDDGMRDEEETYKYGELIKITYFYNGQKMSEATNKAAMKKAAANKARAEKAAANKARAEKAAANKARADKAAANKARAEKAAAYKAAAEKAKEGSKSPN
jgi:antitoxin component YwqK of YwqJK toxin-antitoxin module